MAGFRMPMLATLVTSLAAAAPVTPVSKVDVDSFLGHWYQVYGSASVKYLTELGANCVTADYTRTNRSDVLAVKNTVYPLGHKFDVTGYAIANPQEEGEFQVALGPQANPAKAGSFSASNFIIIGLGPLKDGKYDYALVTDPTKLSLYVLTRDTGRFAQLYDADVLAELKNQGFSSLINKPLKTNQEGCKNSEVIVV